MGNSAFLSFAGLLGFLPPLFRQKPKKTFVHQVYFWLNNPDSAEDRQKLLEGLRTLEAIKAIRMAHIGVPASTNRDVIERGYTFSWLLLFDNLDAQEIYQKHPIHLKFIENYAHLWDKVIVYDSEEV